MKKSIFSLLLSVVLCATLAFASVGVKTFDFGKQQYKISELAPEFITWDFMLLGTYEIATDPTPCSLWIFEGVNPAQTVVVRLLIIKEPTESYLAGVAVLYILENKPPSVDIYEDTKYFETGKPSFILSKVETQGDLEKLILMKKMQFSRRSI